MSAATTSTDPTTTWKALAHLIAARPLLRTWNPDTDKFDRTTNLSSRLPRVPAAAYLYLRGRTQILALDFDTKRHGQRAVDTDFARALTWITECGGVAVTDRSRSGGRHILVPLALGTSASAEELAPLMRLLESRLPTLDKTPMTNPKTGCITVPGSPCRQGGHRQLDGSLTAAQDALTRRSHPALLPRLHVLLGALNRPEHATNPPSPPPTTLIGTGPHVRLDPRYVRTGDMPARITLYATTGKLPTDHSWPSHSEARQSVLAHAVLHGHSLATITALMTPGRPWHDGLARAYARYHHNAHAALQRDVDKALKWAAANSHFFRPFHAQDQRHTRGGGHGPELHRRWLANATAWIEQEFPQHRYRWIGPAVYQALAVHALRSGAVVNGVPLVGVGGRSLSIATGLLSETTVWQFLRDTRDRPGSPLVRTRVAQGRQPDYYALTTQNPVESRRCVIASTRIEDVHSAWRVVGHRHRRVYDLVVHRGLTEVKDVFAAAHISATTGYVSLAALATAGLIVRSRGRVGPGPTSLDDIASAHHLAQYRAQRIERHQRERAVWNTWLTLRENSRNLPPPDDLAVPDIVTAEPCDPHRHEYLSAVLATGPPQTDEERALSLLAEILGATPVPLASSGLR